MRRICGDWWDVKRGDIALGTQLVGCGRGDLAAGGLRVAYASTLSLVLVLVLVLSGVRESALKTRWRIRDTA